MDYDNTKSVKDVDSCLEIFTLGRFVVKRRGQILTEHCERSTRIWDLFKYIITYRNKCVFKENLFNILWPDNECDNPARSLQNFMSKLRLLLKVEGCKGSIINFSKGNYSWNTKYNYWLDVDLYEDTYKKASEAYKNKCLADATELYQNALSLYKGHYLPEYSLNGWVAPVRNHYRRIYLDIVYKLVDIFESSGEYPEAINLCEAAFLLEPYEEELHIQFMEALIHEGEMKLALNHYEYITSFFYKEQGVKPSAALCDLYRKIKVNDNKNRDYLSSIQEDILERQEATGAFCCEPDIFRSIYRLEHRRIARTGQIVFTAMLTVLKSNHVFSSSKMPAKAMQSLRDILAGSLRKGDVISKWSESQFIVLLPEATFEQSENVIKRIHSKFDLNCKADGLILRVELQPIKHLA
jgi:DNA-binding SARP family transcriptional activator